MPATVKQWHNQIGLLESIVKSEKEPQAYLLDGLLNGNDLQDEALHVLQKQIKQCPTLLSGRICKSLHLNGLLHSRSVKAPRKMNSQVCPPTDKLTRLAEDDYYD